MSDDFYWERDWLEVRADEVRVDDLYANGGTVTESRPWSDVDGRILSPHVRYEWVIRCGPDFSTTGASDRRVVVGRNPRRVLIEDASDERGAVLMERGTLAPEQVDVLLRPIRANRVHTANSQSHVPAYDVIAHLTRIFGFEGWDKEVRSIELVGEQAREYTKDGKTKVGHSVTYRCLMRLTIYDRHGRIVKVIEDGATGSSNNQPSYGDAHDLAYKNAISYAIKRCAKDLGDQFGLSLYNKGSQKALLGKIVQAAEDDVESHVEQPQSLGNDERDVEPEQQELVP